MVIEVHDRISDPNLAARKVCWLRLQRKKLPRNRIYENNVAGLERKIYLQVRNDEHSANEETEIRDHTQSLGPITERRKREGWRWREGVARM
jgi:hypothetical protein